MKMMTHKSFYCGLLLLALLICSQLGFALNLSSYDRPPFHTDNRQIDLENPFFQGNFGYRFPIDLASGINGMEPTLALVYNSELTREKVLGVGWELVGYNMIRRNDRQSVPWYDERDTYILTLDGKESVLDGNGTFEEKMSLKAERSEDDWHVYEGDGTVLSFSAAARSPKGTYSWILREVKDPNGNIITYKYDEALLATEGVAYLKSITYMDSNEEQRVVNFYYESHSATADIFQEHSLSCWPGYKEYYTKRLTKIDTGEITYQLIYKESTATCRSLLSEILPSEGDPVTFHYESDELESQERWLPVEKPILPGQASYVSYQGLNIRDIDIMIRDFNGDGLPDLYLQRHRGNFDPIQLTVEMDFLPQIYLNDGQGGWRLSHDFAQNRTDFGKRYKGHDDPLSDIMSDVYQKPKINQDLYPRIYDLNKDGYLDISITAHYHVEAEEQQEDPISGTINTETAIRWDETETIVYLNDGQGRFIYSTKYPNEPSDIYQPGGPANGPSPFNDEIPPILTDVNGDQYTDYFSGNLFFVNQGDGTYQTLGNGGDLKKFFQNKSIDINGDGVKETIAYNRYTGDLTCSDTRYNLRLGAGREYLRPLSERWGFPGELFADINNDGFPDLITLNGVYINQTKSDRMVAVSGDENIKVAYTRLPVASQYGDDPNRKGLAVYRWAVQSITSDDTTTTFAYKGGLLDMERRFFRGFSEITVTDEDGPTTYTYDTSDRRLAGRVLYVESQDGKVTYTYTIDGDQHSWALTHLKTTSVSKDGVTSTTENDYDGDGNLTQQDRSFTYGNVSDTRRSNYQYSKNSSQHIVNTLERSTESAGGQTLQENQYYYDEKTGGEVVKGNLTQIDSIVWPKETGSEDLTVKIGYDGHGVANAVMDADGNQTTTELLKVNDRYKKRVTRNALGHESYELIEIATGLTVESVDANNAKTTYAYYPDKRLKRVTRPDGGFTEYEYQKDDNGTTNITRSNEEKGSSLLFWHEERFDKKGNLISTLDREVQAANADGAAPFATVGRPVLTQKRYTKQGQVSDESLTYFAGETPKFVHYDYETKDKHRLLKVTQPDGSTIGYEYDDSNHRVTVIDPKGNRSVTEERYDYASIGDRTNIACRIVTTTNALNHPSSAYYDLDGNLLKTVDANGKEKVYRYDSLGRVYHSQDPYKGEVRYVYGKNGQLKTRTDAKGQVIHYEYDVLNRLTAKHFPGRTISWNYDEPEDSPEKDNPIYTHVIGRLRSYTDNSGTTQLGYDVNGNLIAKQHGALKLNFSYDLQERLQSITYPNDYKVDYSYDALGLGQVKAGEKVLANYTDRNAFGAAQTIEYANGVRMTLDYDPSNGQLKNIKTGGGYMLNMVYTYDANGNVQSIQDLGAITTYHPAVNNESYTYDTINRLTGANGPYGTLSYTYDAVGNITAKEGVTFTYGDPEHPYAVTAGSNGYKASYDENGNMITRTDSYGNNYSLIYDEENQLIRIWKNDKYSEEYTYDATGYRVARNVGSVKTDYVYWGNTLLYETTGGKDIDYVWAEGKLIAKVEQVGTTYFTHDHLGSSKLQTDDSGKVLSVDVTRPFGPRVCDEVKKDDFTDSSLIDLDKSNITYDIDNHRITAPAKGKAQNNLLANSNTVNVVYIDYTVAKLVQFRLTASDTTRKVNVRFNATGKARVRIIGSDKKSYFNKEYTAKTDSSYSVTADLTKAPNQMYTIYLDLAGLSASSLQASNSLFEVTWGNVGESLGEFYSQPYDLQEDVRSLRLSWAGMNVSFMVSTDNKTWESVENGQATELKNPGKRLWLKGLLKVDANTVLDGYQIEVNPCKYSLFTGKTLEESTGLVYFGGRWYDPEIGRFITVDPAEDGENWYGYCENNPTMYTDPNGLYTGADDLGAFLGGGFIGAGIEFATQAWNKKYDITRVFTAFLKGGLSAWCGLYSGPGGIGVYAFLDATEECVRAKLAGRKYGFGQFAQTFATDMITGVAGGALGKGIAKLAGKLAPSISKVIMAFKNRFGKGSLSPKIPPKINVKIDSYGALRKAGLKDAHHIIQDAAVKDLPGYNRNLAPAVQLEGPAWKAGTPHYRTRAIQRQAGGGTYAAERRIGYKALRKAGFTEEEARDIIQKTDDYFKSLGVKLDTITKIPGDRG